MSKYPIVHSARLPPVPCSVWWINRHFGSEVIGGVIVKTSWETGVQANKYWTPITQRQSQHKTHTRFEAGEGVTQRFMIPQGRDQQGTGPDFAG